MTATQAYLDWDRLGRPYRLARPIEELKALFKTHGVAFLGDLGNTEHLQNPVPKDHTPYPANPWPSPLPPKPAGYIVCACDHANGPWADALLAHAKAGKVPWLKYLNFGGHHYDVRNHWLPEPSSDEHLHISIRSDWTDRSIGAYSPFGDDMALDPLQVAQIGNAEHYLQALVGLTDSAGNISNVVQGGLQVPNVLAATLKKLAGDVADLKARPAATLSDAQAAALAAQVTTQLGAQLTDAVAQMGRIANALAEAGAALGGADDTPANG